MARVGNVPVVSAYRGNIGQQMMKVSERLEGISEDYERKQQQELAEAKKVYTQGLNINLYEGINELRNDPNYSANPKGLSDAMDKVLEKTLSDVTDDEVKSAVMVDYQLKKGTYINHAQTEFNRIQREKARSSAFDTVYANIDSMGLSFANALSGNYTDDDIANYMHSLENIKSNINARDVDGTYIFTDAQRRSMMKDAEGSYLRGFKAVYEQLDDKQQDDVMKAVNDDSFEIVKVTNKETPEEPKSIKLKDVIGDSAYNDIKKYTLDQRRKAVKARLDERKLLGDEALADFYDNPTEEGLEKILEYKDLSENKIGRLRELLESSPNYEAITTYDGVKDATKAMNEFMEQDFDSDEAELNSFVDMMDKIKRTQDAGNVTPEQNNVFVSEATNALRDKNLKKIFQNSTASINDTMEWNAKQLSGLEMRNYVAEHGRPRNDYSMSQLLGRFSSAVKNMMRDGLQAQVAFISNGDIESAEKVKKDTKRQILEFVHPEIKGKKVGDNLIINGKVYKITSLDDNIAVKGE